MKRKLLMLLAAALVLLLGLALTGASLAEPIPENAGTLQLGESATAVIVPNQLTWFAFTPAEDGNYQFYSSASNSDTYGYLYVVDEGEICEATHNDDSGEGNNFLICATLSAEQTYYLGVRFYSREEGGSFPVAVETYEHEGIITPGDSYIDVSGTPGSTLVLKPRSTFSSDDMTYSWSMRSYDAVSGWDVWNTVEADEGGKNLTISVSAKEQYACSVTYLNYSWRYEYTVSVENNLNAYVDGVDYQTSSYTWYVAPGNTKTLAINVSASDMSSITHQWYGRFYDFDTQSWSSYEAIENATSDSLTVDAGRADYYCTVKDQYGNEKKVYFYIYIDNQLTAYVDGVDYQTSSYTWYVAPGNTKALAINVSASDMSSITRQWYGRSYDFDTQSWSSYEAIENATSDSLTVDAGRADYYCQVADQYGNTISVWFYIYIDNQLIAYADSVGQPGVGAQVYIEPGKNQVLKVNVSASDMTGIVYKWYTADLNLETNSWGGEYLAENAATDSLTVESGRKYYVCNVTDRYGNSVNVWFYIYVDNQLTAYVGGVDEQTTSYTYYVAPGNTQTLKTDVSASDMSSITYQWRGHTYDFNTQSWNDYVIFEDATSDTLTVDCARADYYCRVADQYGNIQEVRFYVQVDNQLTAFVDGVDEQTTSYSWYVAPGSTQILKVIVSANDMSGVTYQWQKNTYNPETQSWNGYQVVENAASNSLTTEACRAEYACRVDDQYGNYRYVYFITYIDNDLTAYVDGVSYQTDNYSYSVMPGNTQTLKLNVSASDMTGITYKWYKETYNLETQSWSGYEAVENAASDSLTVNADRSQYYCQVSDRYGNIRNVWFYIYVDNQLEVYVDGVDYQTTNYSYSVMFGNTQTLKVNVSANDMSGITYRWYKRSYDLDTQSWSEYEPIEGAVSDSVTVDSGKAEYYCNVRDRYGNETNVWFYIYIDNQLTAWVDGVDYQTNNYSYYTEPGTTQTLKVTVSASDMTGITCQWYGQTYNLETQSWSDYELIEDAASDSLTVNGGRAEYYCQVADRYGNTREVWFRLYIDNQLTAQVDGLDYQTDNISYYPEPGTTQELKVTVSASDMTGITYQWYRNSYNLETQSWSGEQPVENAASDSLTVNAGRAEYYCQITDRYGNTANVWFYIYIDNQLRAYVDGPDYQTDNYSYYLEPGNTQQLKVSVSASDMTGITYQWYRNSYNLETHSWDERYRPVEDAISDSLTVSFGRAQYYCRVADLYGNTKEVWFNTYIDNQLKAWVDGVDYQTNDYSYYLMPGNTQLLKVTASASDMTNITYEWYKSVYNLVTKTWSFEQLIENETTDSLTVGSDRANYHCVVRDQYGNDKYVWFYVYIENNLTASSVGTREPYVSLGETVTLQVQASCNVGKLFYQWWKEVYYAEGDYWNSQQISGATSDTYTTPPVTGNTRYYCTVEDQYGGSQDVWFTVHVENGLTARSADGINSKTVAPGESATFAVAASCNTGDLTYQWRKRVYNSTSGYYEMVTISGATSSEYTIENIDRAGEYSCFVTDMYNNSTNVWFYLYVNNELTARAVGQNRLSVSPGAGADLAVIASCRKGELSYQWFRQQRTYYSDGSWSTREIEIPGATAASYRAEDITTYTELFCRITDDYENTQNIYFRLFIDNGFVVTSSGPYEVAYGGTALLQVEALCRNGDLTYAWYVRGQLDPSQTGPAYTIENITEYVNVRCQVRDMYGNEETCYFYVHVESNLTWNVEITVNGTPAVPEDYEITVAPGDDIVITVNGSSDFGDVEVFYSWYIDDEDDTDIEVDDNVLTINNIRKTAQIEYEIGDGSGSYRWDSCTFRIDNAFNLEPVGTTLRNAAPGEQVTLEVSGSAASGQISYSWSKDGKLLEGETGNTLTVRAEGNVSYNCNASDEYGNNAGVMFTVIADESRRLTLGESATVSIEDYADKEYLFFTPAEDGTYTLTSSCENQSYIYPSVTLYDGNGNSIGNAYARYGENFSLTEELTAGIRYMFVIITEGDGGTFTVRLTKDDIDEQKSVYFLRTGQSARFPFDSSYIKSITSSKPDVLSVSGQTFTAGQAGTAKLTIDWNSGSKSSYTFTVMDGSVLSLPGTVKMIESQAFAGDRSVRFVALPDGCTSVGAFAFMNSGLKQIVIPGENTQVSVSAFYGIQPTVLCREDGVAAQMLSGDLNVLYID